MPSSHDVSTRLGRLSQDELTRLIFARPWGLGRQQDLHDLADALLTPESIVSTLRTLSRSTLQMLATGEADESARSLLLAEEEGWAYPEVSALLRPIDDSPVPTEPEITGDGGSVALHSIIAIRDLIEWVAAEPLPMGSTGMVLKAEEKILATGLVVSESDAVALVEIASAAGFVRTVDRRLCATARGMSFVDDLVGLWCESVQAAFTVLSESVLAACRASGRLDADFIDWVMPGRERTDDPPIERVSNGLRLCGLVAGATTDLGRAALGDRKSAAALVRPVFPELQSSVYVLDDLSIIAPGPLAQSVSEFLDEISVLETRGLAPKRRLDPALILRAAASGTTVEHLTARLGELSVTPVSAAVTSTIADIATNGRFVTLNGTGTDTAAKASHPELGEMLLNDPRLQRLAPVKVDNLSVLYGASRERVETALLDSRYTVVTDREERVIVGNDSPSKLRELAEHLFERGLGSTHLERALMTAGKSRSRVTLLVETSAGNKTITLEPRQVANGRVRGLDTAADVERTLPISAIIELIAVGE